jgi:uncharacterized protein (TIGR02996 family)
MPATADDLAFLDDIAFHAAEDAPRLIYADFLEDRGGSGDADRADFIRVQVELARLADGHPAERAELTRRELALLRAHLDEWWGELPPWARRHSVMGPHGSFRRGFVFEVGARARDFTAGAAELLRRFPIESLQIHEAGRDLPALAACPHLARLTRLGFQHTRLSPADVEALAGSPHLGNVTVLELSGCRVGDAGVRALAASAALPRLRELYLEQNGIGDAGARALALSAHLAGLNCLALANNGISEAGALALAQAPHVGWLTFLDLTLNPIGAEGARLLRQRFGPAVLVPGRG